MLDARWLFARESLLKNPSWGATPNENSRLRLPHLMIGRRGVGYSFAPSSGSFTSNRKIINICSKARIIIVCWIYCLRNHEKLNYSVLGKYHADLALK